MKVLFIAPIPPPINGQSKAGKVLLDGLLHDGNSVKSINLSKESLKNNNASFGRFLEIAKVLFNVIKHRKGYDIIYLSIAESMAGNIRDLLIYTILGKNKSRVFIHMLGGAGMKQILSSNGILKKINVYFLRKIGGIFVEGPVNYDMFEKVIPRNNIHIVPNFAEDFLFLSQEEIEEKFSNTEPLRILYLSNLIPGKGYKELAKAFISLPTEIKSLLELSFVGGFESSSDEQDFLQMILFEPQITYLGKFVDGEQKKNLYSKSHIFCLPTYYPFEGQPISILEAYATGCVVVTSDHSGIPYVFQDEINGYQVEKKSVDSLSNALIKLIINKKVLKNIALNNNVMSKQKFRTSIFQNNIIHIFKDHVHKA